MLLVGKHCCLWCLTTSNNLKAPPTPCPLRTLEGIKDDYAHYSAAGSDIWKAKSFNNVIHAPLFNVDLDQVYIMYASFSKILDWGLTFIGLSPWVTHKMPLYLQMQHLSTRSIGRQLKTYRDCRTCSGLRKAIHPSWTKHLHC